MVIVMEVGVGRPCCMQQIVEKREEEKEGRGVEAAAFGDFAFLLVIIIITRPYLLNAIAHKRAHHPF